MYYFRVPSAVLCESLSKDFGKRAQKAKKDAEAKSRFEKNQEKVRVVFNSTPFQCSVAGLIFAVRGAGITPVKFLFCSLSLAVLRRQVSSEDDEDPTSFS